MTRIAATTSHFILSIVIFSVLFSILIFFWYPSPYFNVSGGWEGLKIAASVDLVLGPLLTFVIFNTKKDPKKRTMDLSIIVFIQLLALLWGMVTIYQQRPVATVFWLGSFLTVIASDFTEQNVDLTVLDNFGESHPVLVYVPDVIIEHKQYQFGQYADTGLSISPFYRSDLFQPLQTHFSEIQKFQLDILNLIKTNELVNNKLMMFLAEKQKQVNDFQYYKMFSKYNNVILIFSPNGELVGHLIF